MGDSAKPNAPEPKMINVVSIAGRVADERERLIGMTPEERAWRIRFLKSQDLAPEEPIVPEGYYKEYYNPIRRFYRAPLDKVENALVPMVGNTLATNIRKVIGKGVLGILTLYCSWYYYKYHMATWERKSGWRLMREHDTVLPGDKNYPYFPAPKKPNEFGTFGFEKSRI